MKKQTNNKKNKTIRTFRQNARSSKLGTQSRKHKNHDDANTTQQTPEITFIHTPKGRILISSDRNFLEFSELMNGIIKKRAELSKNRKQY